MNQNQMIKEKLLSLVEQDYQKFSSSLNPGVENILGVRLPALRSIAKELAKNQWQAYLNTASDETFEEIMLQGMTIGYVKAELSEILPYITQFIPKISNWAICDSFCSSLKITKKYPTQIWNYILPYLTSQDDEYSIRFGVVMIINYYIDEEHIDQILTYLDGITHPGYYVKMSVAWAISMCFVSFPDKTMNYLKENTLDDETYNKSLQKITESLKVNQETKQAIRKMKR